MKFGRARMLRVLDHHEVRRSFYWRQFDLALVAGVEFGFFVFSGEAQIVFAILTLLCVICGASEAKRMRACGRYHQCRRSLEAIGI
jgi:hypothetical protein